MQKNIHTWARLTRLDLQNFSISLGNAALEELANWPPNGDGRAVKAATETITRKLDHTFDRTDLDFILDNLKFSIEKLSELSENSFFNKYIHEKKYTSRRGEQSTYGNFIAEAFPSFLKTIRQNRPKSAPKPPVPQPTVARPVEPKMPPIGEVVPAQHLAPLQFTVINGKLHLKRQISRSSDENRSLLNYGRTALQDDATAILSTLSQTNVDPRFTLAFTEVRDILRTDADIIRLGMLSNTCDALTRRFSEQLPEIVSARVEAFSTNLIMFVSQFPDWQKFSAAVNELHEIRTGDIVTAFSTGMQLIETIKDQKDLVDPQVPISLKLLLEAIRDPSTSSKRAAFGVIRTLENLIGTIFLSFGGLFGAGFAGIKEGLKTSAKIATVAILLSAATHAASNLSPSVSRITNSNWLEQASKIIEKALEP